jgi:hypothetical protein
VRLVTINGEPSQGLFRAVFGDLPVTLLTGDRPFELATEVFG